jgi:methylated-DNA-[protein]-cysteine S-methyltransferase
MSNAMVAPQDPYMSLFYSVIASPVGRLKLVATDRGLAAVLWDNEDPQRVRLRAMVDNPDHPMLVETARQLREYFAGTRTVFTVPLDMAGTEFQRKVWSALLTIPFGETRTYAALARQLGNPKASRAVGAANGKNPISIITPCHRMVGSDGSLTGFAGGLETKQYLLDHERGR